MIYLQKNILTFFLLIILSFACNPPENKEQIEEELSLSPEEQKETLLQEEVLAIHDEIMPNMDNLMQLKEQLLIKVDSLQEQQGEEQKINQLRQEIEQLRKADSAMMTWMRQFKAVRDTVTHEQRIAYLEKEKERIEQVRKMMLNAIEEAGEIRND